MLHIIRSALRVSRRSGERKARCGAHTPDMQLQGANAHKRSCEGLRLSSSPVAWTMTALRGKWAAGREARACLQPQPQPALWVPKRSAGAVKEAARVCMVEVMLGISTRRCAFQGVSQ